MSLDFQQVRAQVVQLGETAPLRAEHLSRLRREALDALHENAARHRELRNKVQSALEHNANLRCALPGEQPLDAAFPLPPLADEITVLAADGSQINPDRHTAVDYCLVNVGAIRMRYGTQQPPETTVRSRLFYDAEMYTPAGRITERLVALRRDLRERQLLAELAEGEPRPLITLTDGPLELWVGREGEPEARAYQQHFKDYLKALKKLHTLGASAAGYIDRPRGDLLVRLLEIARLPDNALDKAGRDFRPWLGVTDADLFRGMLRPGERSAVFGIQSRNAGKYAGELALHFFYLNVGRDDRRPYPVRVEIPAWVAESAVMLDQIHAVLVDQCRILGTRTYPYLLHRSHEVAVVTRDEKQQVERMISQELQRRRLTPLGLPSEKQAVKDLPGRARR